MRLNLKLIEDGTNCLNQSFVLSLYENSKDSDGFEAELYGDVVAAPFIYQNRIRNEFHR